MKQWGIALLLFLLSATPAFALTPTITNVPTSINHNQEFTVDMSLPTCSNCSSNSYLRGVFFYPETSDSYSGFSQNNSGEWIGSSNDRTKYFLVSSDQTKESTWSGQLKFKFDGDKPGGNYFFKVGRYTSAEGSSADWSEKSAISVTGPPPTSTPIPPTSKPDPTSTPIPPTSTPKPTSTPIPTPKTPTSTPVQTPALLNLGQEERISPVKLPDSVLGESTDTPSSFPWVAILMIGSGLIGLSVSAFLLLRRPPMG